MKKTVAKVIAAIALVTAAFYGGYLVRDRVATDRAAMEDYALSNILTELAYAGYLRQGQYSELRRLIDVSLNGHLNRAREHAGAISSSDFAGVRTRTLAKVADLWNANPPFLTEDFRQSKDQEWYAAWEHSYRANVDLIKAAQTECERTRCNAPNSAPKGRDRGGRP
jgi:hypothetical protein